MAPSSFPAFLRAALVLSTEGVIGDDQVEREYVFFGKMDHPEELKKALWHEHQEQWRILLPGKNPQRQTSVRIRSATAVRDGKRNDTIYTLTIKSFIKGEPGNVEGEVVLDAATGAALMKVFREEGDGMIKTRYFFPVTGTQKAFPENTHWEVDVFPVNPPAWKDGRDDDEDYVSRYVKLDFEVLDFNLKLTDTSFELPFPLTLSEVVYSQPHARSPEDEARVKQLMDTVMKAK